MRNKDIDFIKGIGIFTVVLGHVWFLPSDMIKYIYAFHMPLFFLISGYLFKESNLVAYTKKKFVTLIIPYMGFYVFSFLCATYINRSSLNGDFFFDSLKGFFLAARWNNVYNFALWYLPVLFLSSIVFQVILNFKSRKIFYFAILVAFLTTPLYAEIVKTTNGKIPWDINVVLPAVFFLGIGYIAKQHNYLDKIKQANLVYIAISLLLGGVGLVLAFYNPQQILFVKSYDYLFGALFTVNFLMLFLINNQNRLISYIGINSLWIFGFHRLIIQIISISPLARMMEKFPNNFMIKSLIVVVLAILISLALGYIVSFLVKRIRAIVTVGEQNSV